MSKEVEALKRIETTFSMNKQGKESVYREYTNSIYPYYEDFDLVLKALERLETIDNSKPSEALKCLEGIENALWDDDFHYQRHSKLLDIIQQVLLKAQEQEKFLDSMLVFKNSCVMSCFGYKGKQVVAMPEEAYDEFMKQETVLEIINKKNVDIKLLKLSTNLLDYYTMVKSKTGENTELIEEEFNLLKEWLGE